MEPPHVRPYKFLQNVNYSIYATKEKCVSIKLFLFSGIILIHPMISLRKFSLETQGSFDFNLLFILVLNIIFILLETK